MKIIFKILLSFLFCCSLQSQTIRVGAKHFNESYILGEIISQMLEAEGYKVERKFNLGGTKICFDALNNNELDVYPEYTGTISSEILKLDGNFEPKELSKISSEKNNLELSEPYGFNNTYAFVVKKEFADKLSLKKISDLRNHPELKIAVSYEFLKRKDGWENLSKVYNLPQKPVGIEHGLAYQALDENKIELTDAYSTDGEITKYNLVVLEDDLNFFPKYFAVSFYRKQLDAKIKIILNKLSGRINDAKMQSMNASVLYEKKTFSEAANKFLLDEKLVTTKVENRKASAEIMSKLIEHLKLTFLSLLLSIIVAVPLGIILYLNKNLAKPILYLAGLMQTIPSIALLALMIPLFGIGVVPAIAALFLYAILPILRNTATGLMTVEPLLKKVATGMGLNTFQKLKFVEIPLAVPTIIAGIKTAAVINVGTATLAAFIGAGGLGEFIVTGLALNNTELILKGAIPAALLALALEIIFEVIEKIISPEHLK